MENLQQGWQAYRRGDYQSAVQSFENTQGTNAFAGRALSLLSMGRGEEAAALVEQKLQRSPSPDLEALLADIKGRQGGRSEAERILKNAVSRQKNNGFYRSLLAEQRIRLGRWDDGTEDFIAALNMRDDRTFPHVKRVVADMVDAVTARRIPREDALRFINRIDYSASDKTQAMNSFFAASRRALNAGRRMDRGNVVEAWSVGVDAADDGPSRSSPPPSASNPPPKPRQNRQNRQKRSRPSSPRRRNRPNNSNNSANSQNSGPSPAQQRQQELQQRLAQRSKSFEVSEQPRIDAKRKDMSDVMQQERHQNESLQDLVADVYPPVWPSQTDQPIDSIEPIGFSEHTILRGSNDIETANFRITGGDIGVEITLERCMHNLIAAASAVKPTTLPLTLESIPRVEMNLLDNFIKDMPSLDALYRDETEVEDARPLAIGKFIGECIVQSYGGVWQHDVPADETVIHLGDHVLDPIGLAREFLQSGDFDTVSLRDIVADAEHAVETSTAFPTFAAYLDPTSGLEKEALVMRLAELWAGYRFCLPDKTLPKIAASLSLLHEATHFIALAIDTGFVPSAIVKHVDGAVDPEQRARLGYIRDTGEFLLLSSRKHFCRLMEVTDLEMRRETAPELAGWIQNFFRPGWHVMVDEQTTQKSREKYGTKDLKPPKLQKKGSAYAMRLHAVDRNRKIRTIKLAYRPSDQPLPYELTVG